MTQQYEKLPEDARRFTDSSGTTIVLGTGENRVQLLTEGIQSISQEGQGGRILMRDQRKIEVSREDLPNVQTAYNWARDWRREHAGA